MTITYTTPIGDQLSALKTMVNQAASLIDLANEVKQTLGC